MAKKYAVETRLFTSCYERGDLSSEMKLISVDYFNTQKEVKNFILRKTGKVSGSRGNYSGFKFTGKEWIEENTGEKCQEYYDYRSKKL